MSSSDSGSYTCTATNDVGSNTASAFVTVTSKVVILSCSFLIFTLVPPYINSISPSTDYYLPTGSSLTITCDISTQQGSTLIWYHNGTRVTESGRVQILQTSPVIWTLTVAGTVIADSGVYTCNVTNSYVFDFISLNVIIGSK